MSKGSLNCSFKNELFLYFMSGFIGLITESWDVYNIMISYDDTNGDIKNKNKPNWKLTLLVYWQSY